MLKYDLCLITHKIIYQTVFAKMMYYMCKHILFPELIKKMVVSIGDVSAITLLPIRQLRYWEDKGIITSVAESGGKTRRFDYANIKKVLLIKELMDEGYTLEASVKKVDERIKNLSQVFSQLNMAKEPGANLKEQASKYMQVWLVNGEANLEKFAHPAIKVHYPHFNTYVEGVEAYRKELKQAYAIYPDLTISLKQVLVAGNKVTIDWSRIVPGVLGVAASGKVLRVNVVTILTFAQDKVTEEQGMMDNLGLMTQLGYFLDFFSSPKGVPW